MNRSQQIPFSRRGAGILDRCCFAWNKRIDMPWKIMSIGKLEWAFQPDLVSDHLPAAVPSPPFFGQTCAAIKPADLSRQAVHHPTPERYKVCSRRLSARTMCYPWASIPGWGG